MVYPRAMFLLSFFVFLFIVDGTMVGVGGKGAEEEEKKKKTLLVRLASDCDCPGFEDCLRRAEPVACQLYFVAHAEIGQEVSS